MSHSHTALPQQAAARYRRSGWRGAAALLAFLGSAHALAQAPAPSADSPFDVQGLIQEAALDSCSDALCGGTIKLNGQSIVIPSNTIVILPANALTWKELFLQAPEPYSGAASALALADQPPPLTSFEAHVVGNQVDGVYIAGLVYVAQQALNQGAGLINHIDYASGEMRVGGRLVRDAAGVPQNQLDLDQPGARVRINDPDGRFGRADSADVRFTLDGDNPTVRSATGFPMCLPRVDPNGPGPDPACPQGNRPRDPAGQLINTFSMPDPATLAAGQLPDARLMAPFEVGDYLTYAGTLVGDNGSQGPLQPGGATYISAHTAVANLGIFTAPGANPAYVAIDVGILGNGGVNVAANMEAVVRTRFEGMTTDPSRFIRLFGIDVAPDGSTSDRDWGAIGVDPGPPNGTVKGRWRFRPPCTALTATVNICYGPLDENTFLPATREVRAVIQGGWHAAGVPEKNGLRAGQYHALILEYLFQESFPGTPQPPVNFATMPFLASGGYRSSSGVVAGQLKPWPASSEPASSCTAPLADAGPNITVASGAQGVALTGSASGSGPFSYQWLAPAGIVLAPSALAANPSFNAPLVLATNTYLFTLTVTGCNGLQSTAAMTVTVTLPSAELPLLNPIAARGVSSGTKVTLSASGSGAHPLSYTWSQSSGVAQPFSQSGGSASMSFTHTLAAGKVTNDVLGFTVFATDTVSHATSAPVTASVTVTPLPDAERITLAEYRVSKQRLDLTATSSVVSPDLILSLQPYRTSSGAIYDPAALGSTMTNNGGGNYTLSLAGAPQPDAFSTPLVVKSNIGGASAPTALTRVRIN